MYMYNVNLVEENKIKKNNKKQNFINALGLASRWQQRRRL